MKRSLTQNVFRIKKVLWWVVCYKFPGSIHPETSPITVDSLLAIQKETNLFLRLNSIQGNGKEYLECNGIVNGQDWYCQYAKKILRLVLDS